MLKKSPFFDFLNRRHDSSFEEFVASSVEDEHYINWNEFLLPNDYGSAESEYFAIRNSCAICDVSPMRKIRVCGEGAGPFFDRLLTRPISKLSAMQATYTVLCNADGSLKDDAIVYKFADDDYLMMPSDVDHTPYFETVCAQFNIKDVRFTECTENWAGVAIQGPLSATALRQMGFDSVSLLRPFEVCEYDFAGGTIYVARMGFTADLGYECWLSPSLSNALMESVTMARTALSIEIPGYGLAALQVCRLEGGFIVAGWDCSTEIDPAPGFERSPFELGLAWLVNLDGDDFVGRDALVEQKKTGQSHFLRYFSIDENIQPADGSEIYAIGSDEVIGLVSCSSWSWGLQKLIGNASIKSGHDGQELARVFLDGKSVDVHLSRTPLVELRRRNQVPAPK